MDPKLSNLGECFDSVANLEETHRGCHWGCLGRVRTSIWDALGPLSRATMPPKPRSCILRCAYLTSAAVRAQHIEFPEISGNFRKFPEIFRKFPEIFREFPGRFSDISRTFPGFVQDISRTIPGHFLDLFRTFPGHFPIFSWTFPGHFPESCL